MNILHISDIHFRRTYEPFEDGYKGMLAKMQNPMIPLSKCLKEVKKQTAIDLLIISGDLTEDGEAEDYRSLKQSIQKLAGNSKVIVTLGNHDIKTNFRSGWLLEAPSDKPYNFIESFDEFHVISFDSSMYGNSNGQVTDKAFEWLEHAFEKTQDKPIVFLTHHHLLESQSSIACLPESDRLLKLLKKQNLLCILTGHTHQSYADEIAGNPYFTVGGMSFVGKDEGSGMVRFEESYGYNIYRITDGELIHHTCEDFSTGKRLNTVDMTK